MNELDGFVRRHFTTFGSIPGTIALVAVGIAIALLVGELLWAFVFFALAAVSLGLWVRRRSEA